jgi:hypothetical protein
MFSYEKAKNLATKCSDFITSYEFNHHPISYSSIRLLSFRLINDHKSMFFIFLFRYTDKALIIIGGLIEILRFLYIFLLDWWRTRLFQLKTFLTDDVLAS